MESGMEALYQEIILEHHRYPRNFGRLAHPTHEAHGYNPLCGDEIHLTLEVQESTVKDIKFEGKSCAICRASASVMTTVVKGQPLEEVDKLYQGFHELLTQEEAPAFMSLAPLMRDKLGAFASVRNFPMRVKCATLPWHTLHTALYKEAGTIASTE